MELLHIKLTTGQWFYAPKDQLAELKDQLKDTIDPLVEFQSYDGEYTIFKKELFASLYLTTPETRVSATRNENRMRRENARLKAEASDPVNQL